MKRFWLAAGIPLSVALIALVYFGWSEAGFRQLVRIGVAFSDGAVTIDKVQGRLSGQWRLEGVQVQTPVVDVSCETVVARWQLPALFHGTVRLVALHGDGIVVQVKDDGRAAAFAQSADKKAGGREPEGWVWPELPLGLVVEQLDLERVVVLGLDGSGPLPVDKVSLALALHRNQMDVGALDLRFPGGTLHVQGHAGLGGKWPLEVQGYGSMKELGGTLVAADFTVDGTLMALTARVDVTSPVKTTVNLSCSDPLGEVRWQADTAFSQLNPASLSPGWPDLTVNSAELRATGTVEGYQGSLRLEGVWQELPVTRVQAEVSGDLSGLHFSSLVSPATVDAEVGRVAVQQEELRPPSGTVAVRGKLGWQDGLSWQLALAGTEVDPEPYFPAWRGSIDIQMDSGGRLQGGAYRSESRLAALGGQLFGHPLAGSGTVIVENAAVQISELFLQSGESRLAVQGTVNDVLDLQVNLAVADLGALLPEAGGTANFQGQVRGSRETPAFTFELAASRISFQENRVQSLTGTGKGVLSPEGEVAIRLAGKELRVGDVTFASQVVELDGTLAAHRLLAKASGPGGEMELTMTGGMEEMAWRGELNALALRLSAYGDWSLSSPAALRIDGGGIDLASSCLEQGDTRVCVQGDWQPDGGWRLNAGLEAFSCAELYRRRILALPVDGEIEASMHVTGEGAQLLTGEGRIAADQLQIAVHTEEGREQLLRWNENMFTLQLIDGRLSGKAQTRFQDGSVAEAVMTVDGVGDLSSSWAGLPVSGRIDLDVKDLAPVAALADYTVRPTGSLEGTFAVQGVLGNPRVSGELRQLAGNVFIPATGITLEGLQLAVAMNEEGDGMSLTLDAVSGPGAIRIAGELKQPDQGAWEVQAVATGHGFEVVHLPEYEILLDPDLRFSWLDGVVQVSGKAVVPHAVIAIEELDASVSASGDVVLVDVKEVGNRDLPLKGSVEVELGEDVRVDAFGLKGKAQGTVTVSDAPGRPLTGQGSLTLHDGIYVVRDRALDIARGRFSFQGGPLENPGIDILAQKKNRNKIVGVLVSGTVNDMDLKLFSDPPMAESQILTELLAGRSFSESSHQVSNTVGAVAAGIGLERSGAFVEGILSRLEDRIGLNDIYVEQGEQSAGTGKNGSTDVSVMIGKELFEDLYISYGYDPFKASGIFKARYNLGRGFSVETEVGADQTGADLLWSIEK